jgi:transcriptional regulator with XRE-family HTH domain
MMNRMSYAGIVWPNRVRDLREERRHPDTVQADQTDPTLCGQRWRLVDLAKKAGLTTGYLTRVERGLQRPSADAAKRIAEALGLEDPSELEAGDVELAPIGVAQVLGAHLRMLRSEAKLSMASFAHKMSAKVDQRLADKTSRPSIRKAGVSESFVRNLEAGFRIMEAGDVYTQVALEVLGVGSFEDFYTGAAKGYGQGLLDDVLASLHPGAERPPFTSLFAGGAERPAATAISPAPVSATDGPFTSKSSAPPAVAGHMTETQVAIRIESTDGDLPIGAWAIVELGAHTANGWHAAPDGRLLRVQNGHVGSRPISTLGRDLLDGGAVRLIVLP